MGATDTEVGGSPLGAGSLGCVQTWQHSWILRFTHPLQCMHATRHPSLKVTSQERILWQHPIPTTQLGPFSDTARGAMPLSLGQCVEFIIPCSAVGLLLSSSHKDARSPASVSVWYMVGAQYLLNE